jgi:hypothetical protein
VPFEPFVDRISFSQLTTDYRVAADGDMVQPAFGRVR